MRVNSSLLRAARGKFGYLLLALLALLVSAPVITEGLSAQLFLALTAGSVLVAGLFAAVPRASSLIVGLLLAAIDLGIGRLSVIYPSPWLFMLQSVLWLCTLLLVTVIILEVVLASRPVTLETLQAAFCAFLLLGLVWAYFYMCISLVAPDSFRTPVGSPLSLADSTSRRIAFLRYLIFSYSRMAMTSYSGLSPVSDHANIFACLEAMLAQVYLAVVIARLVGLQASQARAHELEGDRPRAAP
jgi:hypothetical protein